MKETNYWQQFMSTGSIMDYLSYRSECKEEVQNHRLAEPASEFLGVNSYAGVCSSNGNDFKDGACR